MASKTFKKNEKINDLFNLLNFYLIFNLYKINYLICYKILSKIEKI